jgi:hypothetical protein
LAIPRATQIAGEYLVLRELVVSVSSIKSMAGTTVARFGVEREKNNVASLKIYSSNAYGNYFPKKKDALIRHRYPSKRRPKPAEAFQRISVKLCRMPTQ